MSTFLAFVALLIGFVVTIYWFYPAILLYGILKIANKVFGFTDKSIVVHGYRWHYLEGGNKNGPVVVLLHGFGANKESWIFYARLLTSKYRVIIPDFPGFGASEPDANKDYSAESQAKSLHHFLHAIQAQNCHIAGNSMGGFIAAKYAMLFKDETASLCLFNNAGLVNVDQTPFYDDLLHGRASLVIRTFEDLENLQSKIMFQPPKIPSKFLNVFADEAIQRADLFENIFMSLKKEALANPLEKSLTDISTPTFVLWGRHDAIFDYRHANFLIENINNCSGVVLEETGHVPMLERPNDTARHHIRFLEMQA